eukprot:3199495-Prymnesium_polylepis.2
MRVPPAPPTSTSSSPRVIREHQNVAVAHGPNGGLRRAVLLLLLLHVRVVGLLTDELMQDGEQGRLTK